jgi:hypothetical protein
VKGRKKERKKDYATRKFKKFHPILLPLSFIYKVKRKIRRCSERKEERKKERKKDYATRKFKKFHPILLPLSFTYKVKRKIQKCSERKDGRKKETEIIWKNGTSNGLFWILDVTSALLLC